MDVMGYAVYSTGTALKYMIQPIDCLRGKQSMNFQVGHVKLPSTRLLSDEIERVRAFDGVRYE